MHVLYEEPALYLEHPSWILQFWRGGFVFYGGAIVATLGSLWFLHFHKQPIRSWLNASAPVIALGYALGRLACLFTGCCFGKVCLWYPNWPFRHPTQLYAVLFECLNLAILLFYEKHELSQTKITSPSLAQFVPRLYTFPLWLGLHSLSRMLVETLRDDDRGRMLGDQSISTWISGLLLVVAVFIFRATFKTRTHPNMAKRLD